MKLAALIEAASEEIGIKPSEAKTRARFMREHGFLRSGGRGKGAADMQPDDLAALLIGLNSFSEPTGAGYALRDTLRARFDYCEWFSHAGFDAWLSEPEGGQSAKSQWSTAPLSSIFGSVLEINNPIWCLAKILHSFAQDPTTTKPLSLANNADESGLSWSFRFSEMVSANEMRARYVEFSGDETDGWYFAESNRKTWWMIKADFLLLEDQQDRRDRVSTIHEKAITSLVKMCAGQWEDTFD